ncbi:MAG: hypothetical protein KDC84_04340 [Crocinitomicaceae bacterium]|nr:hypothetical protein [Crocinitomicaceae bacterium]
MDKKARNFKSVIINYITFESGDNEALIDCKIKENKKERESKLIISMSDLNKLISSLKKIISADLNMECHTINGQSNFYQIDVKKSGIAKVDLSQFFKTSQIKQIVA